MNKESAAGPKTRRCTCYRRFIGNYAFNFARFNVIADLVRLKEHNHKTSRKCGKRALKRKADKSIILRLSSILVWFVALLAYVTLSSLGVSKSWLAFFYAVPANAIVLLSLRSAWHDFRWNQILISAIMWGSVASVYATLLVLGGWNVWRIFLLGIPGQIAILLWFRLFRTSSDDTNKEDAYE